MPEIILANRRFLYHVKRKPKSKTITLRLVTPTTLEITAPKVIDPDEIQELLQQKQKWIFKKAEHLSSIAANPLNISLDHGSQLLYQGRSYLLHLKTSDTKRPAVFLTPGGIHVSIPAKKMDHASTLAHELLRNWYVENATRQFTEKTIFWAGRLSVQPAKISIRDQKTRWGSCSSRGTINYNWRVIMAPPEIMDYLVVHELCHMRIANHSAFFWQLVGQFMPEYRQRRNWLRQNSDLLTRIL